MLESGFLSTSSDNIFTKVPHPPISPNHSIGAKRVMREIFGGGRKEEKVEGEKILPFGRGGYRRPKSLEAAYVHPVDALLASASVRERTVEDADNRSETSCTPSDAALSNTSKVSKVTIKTALKEVLGGGGNDHGPPNDGNFTRYYGRGGTVRSPKKTTLEEPVRVHPAMPTSPDNISRNTDDLPNTYDDEPISIACGRAAGGGDVVRIGPGEGIFHPHAQRAGATSPPNASLGSPSKSSTTKTGQSKISVKIAVKEVLGGGGNDHEEWKYYDVFHHYYGRGGEGARMLPSPNSMGTFSFVPTGAHPLSTSSESHPVYEGRRSDYTGSIVECQEDGDVGLTRYPSRRSRVGSSRVKARERSFSDGAHPELLAHLREERARGANHDSHLLARDNQGGPSGGVWSARSARSFRSLDAESVSLMSGSDRYYVIPPPPRTAPPLPPTYPAPAVSSPSDSFSDPPTSSGYDGTPFSYGSPSPTRPVRAAYTTQRRGSLPTMPARPYATGLTPIPSLSSSQIPGNTAALFGPFAHPPLAATPALLPVSPYFSVAGPTQTLDINTNLLVHGLASLAQVQLHSLQLAQTERSTLLQEREHYITERDIMGAERDAIRERHAALEREKEEIAAQRDTLAAQKSALLDQVHGLKKEVVDRQNAIDGLSWLVGNLDVEKASGPGGSEDGDVTPTSHLEEGGAAESLAPRDECR